MAIQTATALHDKDHRFTLAEYERMIEAGVFGEESHIELIRGEIIAMSPPSFTHEFTVARLIKLLERRAGEVALVWPQGNSIRLPSSASRPQPDVALLRWRESYSKSNPPTAEDVLLLIEVSDSSLRYDKGDKLRLYAESNVPEYWVVDLQKKVVEVYSTPDQGDYMNRRRVGPGEVLPLPGDLQGTIAVDEILR